ncbi:M56 family metallopeptidase [Streptomyces montanisoli]|uniref:M56 family metallopeptidase n=1 Tax=Streptomyces montanisoli TaxID=2798581 RepID=A0A940M4N3_9ACTN|nr:M56 family metallopeptidase [Streptomyces montanisoli]MBP0456045.1 M56 family metallopeptidase [Streptomyces montanisoli]
MNAVSALIGYAGVIGFLAPRLLLRSSWPHRAPVLAVAAWQALAMSFVVAVSVAVYEFAEPTGHEHAGVLGLLQTCGLAAVADHAHTTSADLLAVAVPAALTVLLLGVFSREVVRAHQARSRHRAVLDLVGRRSSTLRATIIEHALPAAYCLPGRCPRVVVSQGALQLLSADQLDAVLDHERAHIAGRHHLVLAAAEAFAKIFRGLPLARHVREQTGLLLEMIADDRALRCHSRDVLATAMYEMAAAKTPRGAFAAGGPNALLRLRRLLTPQHQPHPAFSGSIAAVAVTVPLLPLLAACAPSAG